MNVPTMLFTASSCNTVKCRFYSQIQNIIDSRSKSVTCRLAPPTTTTNQNRECDARKASASCRPRHLHSRTFGTTHIQQHEESSPNHQHNITGGWPSNRETYQNSIEKIDFFLGRIFFNLVDGQGRTTLIQHTCTLYIPYHTIPYHTTS